MLFDIFMVGDLLDKWEMRKEQIITRQYNLFLKFVIDIIMALYIKNLLKQLPFYGKTIKLKIKNFTNTKLLS